MVKEYQLNDIDQWTVVLLARISVDLPGDGARAARHRQQSDKHVIGAERVERHAGGRSVIGARRILCQRE